MTPHRTPHTHVRGLHRELVPRRLDEAHEELRLVALDGQLDDLVKDCLGPEEGIERAAAVVEQLLEHAVVASRDCARQCCLDGGA
eukprot:217551-Chlamydomonas_euryale.AAC.1